MPINFDADAKRKFRQRFREGPSGLIFSRSPGGALIRHGTHMEQVMSLCTTCNEVRQRPVLSKLTATVMAGIHWQALRLWWKGVPVVRRLTGDGVGERAAYAAETAGRTDPVMER